MNKLPSTINLSAACSVIRDEAIGRAQGLAARRLVPENPPMPIIGHGVDIAEVARIARMQSDHGRHFLDRCFTPAEQTYCLAHRHSAIHLAGRFAAKEAVLKVLGTGWRGEIAWTDMEILNDPAGKPELRLTGECARLARQLAITHWHVSISHTDTHALASAIGES